MYFFFHVSHFGRSQVSSADRQFHFDELWSIRSHVRPKAWSLKQVTRRCWQQLVIRFELFEPLAIGCRNGAPVANSQGGRHQPNTVPTLQLEKMYSACPVTIHEQGTWNAVFGPLLFLTCSHITDETDEYLLHLFYKSHMIIKHVFYYCYSL